MAANRRNTAPGSEDEVPDLSTPEWEAKFAAVKVKRGRPRSAAPKISTTIRIDADIVAAFRAGGRGWQSRINAALRERIEPRRKPAPGRARRTS
jgi:uncharacterized protein (DUF4415 family)